MAFDISSKLMSDDGQWTKLPSFGDAEFCIVRAADRSVRAGRQRILTRDYGRKASKGKMTANDNVDLGLSVTAEYILLGWRGVSVGGDPVNYSVEKCLEFLEGVQGLLEEVSDYSLNDSNYLEAEKVAKKSGKPSPQAKE